MERKTRFNANYCAATLSFITIDRAVNHLKGEGEFSVPLLPITKNLFQNVLEAASQNAERKFRRAEPSV